jgi:hypothetical protein
MRGVRVLVGAVASVVGARDLFPLRSSIRWVLGLKYLRRARFFRYVLSGSVGPGPVRAFSTFPDSRVACARENVASLVVVLIVGFSKMADCVCRVSWRFSCTDRFGWPLFSEIRGPGPL